MIVQSTVVGNSFRDSEARARIKELSADDELLLEAEPGNPYDPNAVKVIDPETGLHLGYLSRESNSEVALYLTTTDESPPCRIISFFAANKPAVEIDLS